MSEGSNLVAGIRAALVQVDANIEALGACRERLVEALAFSQVASHGGGDGMAPQPSLSPAVVHLAVATANPLGAAAQRPKPSAASKPAVRAKKKAGPAPSRPSAKPAPSKSGVLDYVAIAADIVALRAAGTPIYAALAAKYRVPDSTARNWPGKCRRLGLLADEKHVPLRVVEDNTGPADEDAIPFDAQLVAEPYLGAIRLGKRPVQTIADRFNVDLQQARRYITGARDVGALPPVTEPQLPDAERKALLDEYKPEPVA